jgi:hypothetical protein
MRCPSRNVSTAEYFEASDVADSSVEARGELGLSFRTRDKKYSSNA